jgi:hypothetical protein
MPIFEKPVDPVDIDADNRAFEMVTRLQEQSGFSVVTVDMTASPSPGHGPTQRAPHPNERP